MTWLVADGAGSNFQVMIDLTALSARIGLPPPMETLATLPFASTLTFKRTTPPIPLVFRTTGYSGLAALTILRECSAATCPPATWPPATCARVTDTSAKAKQSANNGGMDTVEDTNDTALPAHRDGKGERTLNP